MTMMNSPRTAHNRGRVLQVPAWLSAIAVGQVATITGTTGAGSAPVNFFCGMAWRPDTKEVYIAAAGGHGDSGDNRVVSANLSLDSPSWTIRKAATSVGQINLGQPTNLDGTPNSTHTYTWGNRWVPELGRLMKFGSYATYNTVDTYPNVHGFNPITNEWDNASTYPSPPAGWYGNAKRGKNGENGNVYAIWGPSGGVVRYYNPNTNTWATETPTNLQSTVIYYPWAYNSNLDYMFGLCHGDGSGGTGVKAIKHDPVANRQDVITFNSSAAYTAFVAAGEPYAAMDFNPEDGKFYWYAGTTIYVITPNETLVWDMATYTPSVGTFDSPAMISGGPVVVGRLIWAEFGTIKGFVHLAKAASNIQFLRMA